ncbi:MAG: type IV pilin [Asgard group archaeon]|nr:type IV pilin [Asgard group archaeon]
MNLGKLILKRKKAVSPVIATILLIALTVTAAAIVYFVVVPLLTAKPELVYLNPGKVPATTDEYQVTIQNNGGAVANIEGLTAIELVNTTDTYNPTAVNAGAVAVIFPAAIDQGGSVTWTFIFGTSFTNGGSYTLNIHYDAGKVLEIAFTY